MVPMDVADRIIADLDRNPATGARFRRVAMEKLSLLPGYDWSGIYRLEDGGLTLDEYVGAATDHTRIPVGLGVCGTAVKDNRNQVIQDVRALDNYLSCSLETRSEIVVLIRRNGEVLGQIDIDGHEVGAFNEGDEQFLERVADLIAERW